VVAQTVLLGRSAMISITAASTQLINAVPANGLARKTNGSGLQRAGADAVLGKGRDKDKRRGVPLGSHMGQEVQAAHGRHLDVCNDT